MLIYAPQPDAEFAPVIGGLSDGQFAVLESRLRSVTPAIRYLKELDEGTHPTAPQFRLKLHREDRDRAIEIVHEVMERIRPQLPRLEAQDRELAALVRQFTRVWQANDHSAAEFMQGYLCRSIQFLLERLLHQAKDGWAIDLWLDGIGVQQIKLVRPFEVEIRGYIYIGTTQTKTKEPFEADLQASPRGPALERFSARFGDRSRLTSAAVIGQDITESYHIDETAFHVYVGSTVPGKDRQLIDWAFEFVKR